MYRFFLFRPQLKTRNGQLTFWQEIDKGSILKKLILSFPQGEVRKGHTWVVSSDVNLISRTDIHFKFGRISTKIKGAFDYQNSRFVDTDGEDVEYTDCIFLADVQILAVGKRSGIHVHPVTVAKYLRKLLNMVDGSDILTKEENVIIQNSHVEIPELRDPMPFLVRLRESFKISKYDVEISAPNPLNYKSKIHQPIQDLTAEVNGQKSILSIRNNEEGLISEELESISISAASFGDNAKARVHQNEDDRNGTTIQMRKQSENAYVDTSEVDFAEQLTSFTSSIRERASLLFDRDYRGSRKD